MHVDLEVIQASTKACHARPRPFVSEPADICVETTPWLAESGSYSSGHAAMGWAWALILGELTPDRAEAILTRGLAYGASRTICGVCYVSEVSLVAAVEAAHVSRQQDVKGEEASKV